MTGRTLSAAHLGLALVAVVFVFLFMTVLGVGVEYLTDGFGAWVRRSFGDVGMGVVFFGLMASILAVMVYTHRREHRRLFALDRTIHVERPPETSKAAKVFLLSMGVPLWGMVAVLFVLAVYSLFDPSFHFP